MLRESMRSAATSGDLEALHTEVLNYARQCAYENEDA